MTAIQEIFTPIQNGLAVGLSELPQSRDDDFFVALENSIASGCHVSAYFGMQGKESGATELFAVLSDDQNNRLTAARTVLRQNHFPSLAMQCPQLQLFEREIAEQLGIVPDGHPWFKPVRYRRPWTKSGALKSGALISDAWGRLPSQEIEPGVTDFYRVEGEQVHEVAVGPVHAGVIEPGHFRFQCHGERVFHLEIALGYQHRGIEESLIGGPSKRTLHYMENAAGDTCIAHTSNYCQIIDSLSGIRRKPRAQAIAAIALELERLANHVGDLGALSGDVGYLPTASFCGRIRGDFLNMTALLCGNRFGRGLVVSGGMGYDLDEARASELQKRLDAAEKDTANAVNLLWDTPSVMARFEDTGILPREMAVSLGIVGPAARASGLNRDVRCNQPSGIYRFNQIPLSSYDSGDVFGRAYVRWLEIRQSIAFIRELVRSLPGGGLNSETRAPRPDMLCVSLAEAWRGEACHVALTGSDGRLARYKIVDPSFHNWYALAYAVRGEEISDFPLCNKSFNLSYCGHDL